jgi:membrane-bound lytic murein transglycosylase B
MVSKLRSSVAVSQPSMGGFLGALLLGGLCVMGASTMQRNHVHAPKAIARPQVLVEMIRKPVIVQPAPVVVQPSTYDEESAMSQAQLLRRWDGIVSEASKRFQIPASWIRAVMARESGGRTMLGENKPIISRAGAIGLMQVAPKTYKALAAEHQLGSNPLDARDNVMAGAAYLRWLHQRYGFPAMFAAYNAGPGRLEDHLQNGATLPAETRAYVGGIAKTLKLVTGKSGLDLVKLTRPDGTTVKIDPAQVIAVRTALPGEYESQVKSVVTLARHKQQAIREEVLAATSALRAAGKLI